MHNIVRLLILFILSCLLSACPDPGSDIRIYCQTDTLDPNTRDANGNEVRIGDILRTYSDFDEIQYSVSGVNDNAAVTGTLTVDWATHPQLQDPTNSNNQIKVLEEKSSLNTQGVKSTSYRYIVQDSEPQNPQVNESTKGSMYLWAYGDGIVPNEKFFWTNRSANESSVLLVEKISLLDSPIDTTALGAGSITKTIDHSPMLGCALNISGCDSKFATFNENNTTIGKTMVETLQGTYFEAYEIQINSATISSIGINAANRFPVTMDFRHACGEGESGIQVSFSGKMWMFPEVGIVKYQINCTSGSNFYNLTFDFRNTNIPLPASVSGDPNSVCG